MRKLTTLFLKALPLLFVMLAFTGLKAQTFQYTIGAQTLVTPNQITFDLLLLNLDPATPIEIATVQAGVTINPATYGGGTITAQIVALSSTMLPAQVPTSVAFTQSQNTVKLAAKAPPGCGGGTLMSTDPAVPTRLATIRLNNTQPWNFGAAPLCLNPVFSFTTVPYPTKISWYDPTCVNVALPVSATNCFTVGNLCGATAPCDLPLPFAVTGGGDYCQGGAGVAVGLAGSEADVTYTLYNGAALVGTFPGTGAALNFGLQMAGSYTVMAERVCPTPPNQTAPMPGIAVVNELPSSTVEFTVSECDTYTWPLNGQTYTTSGDYTYVVGCVTHVLDLTITPSSTVNYTETACDSYTWPVSGLTYTATGVYTFVVGCVTHVLDLTITPSSTVEQTEISCGPYTWAVNGVTYSVSGDYTHVVGCVTYILHLTVTTGATVESTVTACDSYTWSVNGVTYTTSGDYTYVDGCITYILHLTIVPSSTVEYTESACGSYTWALNGMTYTASGDYTFVDGCVTHILHLTITPYSTVEETVSACDTYTWALNGMTYTASGDYTYVVGCVTNILHLTIVPSSTVEFTESACDSYTWPLNGMTYTASGDYTYVAGCVTNILHLTITPSSIMEHTVTAYVSYTWAINGVTYTVSGDYTYVDGCVTHILHLTIIPCPAATTWTGLVDNDWFNAGNWNPAVPCATTAVTIPMATNYPTLNSTAVCASVLMQDGASFIGSEFLTVGDVTVLRNFPVPGYHYISSPVSPVIFDDVFPLNQSQVFAYLYDEPSGNWVNRLYSDPMNVGTGYSVLMNVPQVATFNAPFNNNPVALTLSKMNPSGNPNRVGWNLLGNPFPCSLEWDLIIRGAGVDGAVYLWNGSNYVSFVSGVGSVVGGIIPPQNGFFVKTAVDGDFIILPFAARVHSNMPFYKESFTNLLSLKTEGNNYSDEAFIRFSDDASVAFDSQLDAYKLMGIEAAPQLYSMVSNEVLTINTLPMEGNEVVNLGFKAGVNGDYTVNASGIESFDATTPIWLEDLKTGAVQNLRSNPVYNFAYTSGDNENRFRIHFKSAYGTPENSLSGINIYSVNSTVVINNTTKLAGDVAIYDLAGREILRTNMSSDTETRIPVKVAVGSYLVKVVTEKGVSSNKVFIR
jgi:hypothetical protein